MPSLRVSPALLGAGLEAASILPSQDQSGGRQDSAPAPPAKVSASLLTRVRQHVWAPVAFKALAIVFGAVTLAGVGTAASFANANGVPIALQTPAKQPGTAQTPRSGQQPTAAAPTPTGEAERRSDGPTEKIVLNRATADELTKLPGVGRKRAEAIIELRERLRGFKRVNDLLRIRGIGPRSLKKMLPYLVLDEPVPDGGAAVSPPK